MICWGVIKFIVFVIKLYPAQAGQHVNGWVQFNDKYYEFNNAPAYQDRNWGTSFPKWWAWLVANNFKNSPQTILASGGGRPMVLGINNFTGFAIGLKYNGKEYIFRAPDGDRIKADIYFGHWEVTGINSHNEKIVIKAYAPSEKFMVLPFMSPQGKIFSDYEALTGNLSVQLYTRKNSFSDWTLAADLSTEQAGIEYGSFETQKIFDYFQSAIHLQ